MKSIISFGLLLLFFSSISLAQSINARFSTYFYTWERYDSLLTSGANESTTHLRGYQNFLLNISDKKWSFNTLAQTEEDVMNKVGRGFNYRFYNFYFKGKNLFDVVDVKLGRQWVSAGAGKGSIDGLYLNFKFGKQKEYQLIGFGGVLTPLDYRVKDYPDVSDNFLMGAQFRYYGVKDLMLALSYSNKHRKPESYLSLRADSLFNSKEVLVETDSPADRLAGLDFNYRLNNRHNFFGKAYYDLNLKKILRGEINARFGLTDALKLSVGYQYREPQISYNTIFWVFNHYKNQEFEGGLDYTFMKSYNVYARISNVIYEDDNSLKFQIGISHPSYGLSFVKHDGYAGESNGVYAYYNREIVKSKLSLSSSLNYSNYKLGEYAADMVTSFSGLLGFTYRPMPQVSVDLQGQFITNRIYDFDTRFLVGFNYWLFNKF